ncbi:uncharacterized protein BCR38DRAFT_353014 [Pseudomassariella vexata]|uniref:Coiled-coil domain-containing protein 16 n=1 Tax=Pseudomassariella vexata TaxID=1141098 RepID=A0A1Y2DGP9_9PEZI|nr:uncharacterized protein BCR38DRAFT_353014 [Pseudomassariella vexata]ORY58441.1 hypothetical protein BCR38DRAFT_353014 [Pseudomassariella vexata]
MSDARSLLRAHRAANRIVHPHAAYSDSGKLLCKLCHEAIKSESLWEPHTRSTGHRTKAAVLSQAQSTTLPAADNNHKRKHDDVDEAMSDAEAEETDAIRKKRSRTDTGGSVSTSPANGTGAGHALEKQRMSTPPTHPPRRASNTPVHGVEIAIPSRPATPLVSENSATPTPQPMSHSRSPLMGSSGLEYASAPGTQETVGVPPQYQSVTSAPSAAAMTGTITKPSAAAASVDEAEWAAFEAEIAAADAAQPLKPSTIANTNDPFSDATISAPALTADQLAAKSLEEEIERKKHLVDMEMADEKEDAARAMEAEFEEMEELEVRVRRLKERREELRRGSVANSRGGAATTSNGSGSGEGTGTAAGKENVSAAGATGDAEAEGESDDDEEDDEWDDGFRFRA